MPDIIFDGNVVQYIKGESDRHAEKLSGLIEVAAVYTAGTMAMAGKLSDVEADDFKEVYPEWKPNTSYSKGDLLRYLNMSVLVSSNHVSSSVYLPGAEGTGALYRPIPPRDEDGNIAEAIRYMNIQAGECVWAGGSLWKSLVSQLPYTGAYPPGSGFPTVWTEVSVL